MARSGEMSVSYVKMFYGWFDARGDDALNPCASCSCELPRSTNPAVTGAAVTAVLLVAWLMSVILLSLLTVCCRRICGLHRENESFCLHIEKLRCQLQKQEDELITQRKQLARQHVDEMKHLATRCITAVHGAPNIVMSFKLAFGCIKRYITAVGTSATTVTGAVSTVTKCCSDAARCIHRPIDAIINSASSATSVTATRSSTANPTATTGSITHAMAATTPTAHVVRRYRCKRWNRLRKPLNSSTGRSSRKFRKH
ncbi:uncharacterized protein LOC133353235 [Lethenteron reissneri]|uniref:uncharacterized protein LOC133353235 n=1 Tax=Lethenteron reissneri TaxID=7753 RepID=UPI002AB7B81D|nr:uncharacterized protein LOC133353235 [Lethenteron reissneri]